MAQINPNIPILGNPVSTEEPKVKTALETLVSTINALDDANVANNANLNGSKLLDRSVDFGKMIAQPIVSRTTDHTLAPQDAYKAILVNSASNITVTVSGATNLGVGERIDIIRIGTGTVTVSPSGVTLNYTPGPKLRAQYSAASLLCVATNSYLLLGDIAV